MAHSVTKIGRVSAMIAAVILAFQFGSNSMVVGVLSASVSILAVPAVVIGVVLAHDASVKRLDDDRVRYATGDSKESDNETALLQADPDMRSHLDDLLYDRVAFLAGHENGGPSTVEVRRRLDALIIKGANAERMYGSLKSADLNDKLENLSRLNGRLVALRRNIARERESALQQ